MEKHQEDMLKKIVNLVILRKQKLLFYYSKLEFKSKLVKEMEKLNTEINKLISEIDELDKRIVSWTPDLKIKNDDNRRSNKRD